MTRLSLRLDFGENRRLGPGKVRLLELIGEHGSISAAGRAMGMSYKRAWTLIEALNAMFEAPVVAARVGGAGGGKAELTALGAVVIREYRSIEKEALGAGSASIAILEARLSRA